MKKILILCLVAAAAVSCLDSKNTKDYTLIADFEYGPDVKFRSDSTYFHDKGIGIPYNYLAFGYKLSEQAEFLGGFRLSCLQGQIKDGDYALENAVDAAGNPLDLTWRVYSAPMTNSYMVFYQSDQMPEKDVEFLARSLGTCQMSACYVNNTSKVAKEILAKFERGDKFVLKAEGFLNDKSTGSAEINLADYTQNDKNGQPKDSVVCTWTPFDLSKLGKVDKVKFTLDSGEKNVSKYFCLDNMIASIYLEY